MKSPITLEAYGRGQGDLVVLDPDHPGFRDPVYRQRRNDIAAIALAYETGLPVPHAPYTPEEHRVWTQIWEALAPRHEQFVVSEIQEVQAALALHREQIPQLSELNPILGAETGFQFEPVAGLVAARAFMMQLGRGIFLSTQYIRHTSRPFYTPEPDVVHELVGHAATLIHPGMADVNRLMGTVACEASASEMARVENVYWYTMEFGTALQNGDVFAVGAGLLSSVAELEQMRTTPQLLDWDLDRIAVTPYDPTDLQPQLFVAPSFRQMLIDIEAWITGGYWRDSSMSSGSGTATT